MFFKPAGLSFSTATLDVMALPDEITEITNITVLQKDVKVARGLKSSVKSHDVWVSVWDQPQY